MLRGTAQPGRMRRIRPAAAIAYVAIAAFVFRRSGIPVSRDLLFGWIVGLLFVLSIGNLRRFWRGLAFDWLPLAAALTLYDVVRGWGAGRFPIHADEQIWLDRTVFGLGRLPSTWLQERLWRGSPAWYDYVVWTTYTSFFLVTPVLLGVLWLRDRRRFRRYALLLTGLSFASVLVFLVAPTMPPWLAASKGLTSPVLRPIGDIGTHVPILDWSALYERGVDSANGIAAFPSLHEGMTVLVSLVLWPTARRATRCAPVAYPLLMAFSLVYAGEHYVTDVLGGTALALAVVAAGRRLERRFRRPRELPVGRPVLAPVD